MKSFMKITLAIVLAGCLLIGGCVALIGTSADKAIKDTQAESDKTGITMTQYRSIKLGTLRTDVRRILVVPPESKDSTEISDYRSECLYYNRKGHLLSIFQFCFEHHKLVSKSAL